MKTILAWLNEALAEKDIVAGMTYYRVENNVIKATNGRITASHPWPYDGAFLVPGNEFEKILRRMPDNPTLTVEDNKIKLRFARFHGTIQTLPLTEWDYPGVEDAAWRPLPNGLIDALSTLRPFISDNANQQWALCVALENGWAYATNNIAIAGMRCPELGPVMALLPVWAVDFIIGRADDLVQWSWAENYVAFRWSNGAWMRSQLIVGQFPEKAAEMVRKSFNENPTYFITPEFRIAFNQVAELAEDTVAIYADHIESRFGRAEISSDATCPVPEGVSCSTWGARFLLPALAAATHWSPDAWPKPAPFKGRLVSGYVVGRK